MPVRESHKSKDGHSYTLWIDIHDVLKATVPIHARGDRAARRQRNMMFRGHADADWDLVPTLFRAPVSKQIIDQRQKYTDQFMNALVKNSHELKLENLSQRNILSRATSTFSILRLSFISAWHKAPSQPGENTYDSLGEAYGVAGEKDLAIKNYEKSIELNPKNE